MGTGTRGTVRTRQSLLVELDAPGQEQRHSILSHTELAASVDVVEKVAELLDQDAFSFVADPDLVIRTQPREDVPLLNAAFDICHVHDNPAVEQPYERPDKLSGGKLRRHVQQSRQDPSRPSGHADLVPMPGSDCGMRS